MTEWKLVKALVDASTVPEWESARKEWILDMVDMVADSECACGHTPIHVRCHLRNASNGRELVVGRCCIRVVQGNPQRAIDALMRVKKDLTKSIGPIVLSQAVERGVLVGREVDFYKDTVRKRKLSVKQEAWRVALNMKVLRSYGIKPGN